MFSPSHFHSVSHCLVWPSAFHSIHPSAPISAFSHSHVIWQRCQLNCVICTLKCTHRTITGEGAGGDGPILDTCSQVLTCWPQASYFSCFLMTLSSSTVLLSSSFYQFWPIATSFPLYFISTATSVSVQQPTYTQRIEIGTEILSFL